MCTCEHRFIYGGVKYEDGKHSLPGGSAKSRKYFDWFYCDKCLETKYRALFLPGQDSYSDALFGATPK